MLGHGSVCKCPFCNCISRLVEVFESGRAFESFPSWACCRLRLLEAEFRDELQRLGAQDPQSSVAPPTVAAPGEVSKASQAEPASEKTSEKASGSANLYLVPKTSPLQPPPGLSTSGAADTPVKEEPKDDQPRSAAPGVEDLTVKESPTEVPESPKKSKEKRRSRRRGEDKSPRSRSRERRRRTSKRSRRSDSRRRRHRSRSHRSSGGKEKKSHPERPPEPALPPRHTGPIPAWGPREPDFPPPPRQGPGWRGEVPRSDHARWTHSVNKGVVKRAKQEIYARRSHR